MLSINDIGKFSEKPISEDGKDPLKEIQREEKIIASLDKYSISEIAKGVDDKGSTMSSEIRARAAMWVLVKEDGEDVLNENTMHSTVTPDMSQMPIGNDPIDEDFIMQKQARLRTVLKIILSDDIATVPDEDMMAASKYFAGKVANLKLNLGLKSWETSKNAVNDDSYENQKLQMCKLALDFILGKQL